MGEHANFGPLLLLLSLVIAGVGLVWLLGPSVRRRSQSPGSQSPGGTGLEWETFRLSYPLVTCLLLGVLWGLVRWLIRPLRR
jgi:hypothetical protein